MGSPLCTSGEKGPLFALQVNFGQWGPPFALQVNGGSLLCILVKRVPLCTLVNGVSPLHFGQWGPPFALQVNGVPPLHFGEFSVESFLFDEGPSLKTLDLFYYVSTPTL